MIYYEIHEIKNEWSAIREFLLEIVSGNQGRYSAKRIKLILNTDKFKGITDHLNNFDERRRNAIRIAGDFDRTIAAQIEKVDDTKLVDKLIELSLFIEILSRTDVKYISNVAYSGINLLIMRVLSSYGFPSVAASVRINDGFKRFLNEEGGIEDAIVTLTRLVSCLDNLERIIYTRESQDDELFRPSGISSDVVVQRLDKAIEILNHCKGIGKRERERLIEYIGSAKRELTESKPSWPRIIGILLIVCAVTSGVADVKSAIDNIKSAMDYIVTGTSKVAQPSETIPRIPAAEK